MSSKKHEIDMMWERKRHERILQEEYIKQRDKLEGIEPMSDKMASIITIGSIIASALIMFL